MKRKILYTLRWFAKEIQNAGSIERCMKLGQELEEVLTMEIDKSLTDGDRETPAPGEVLVPVLALVIGHEQRKPGAAFYYDDFEYQWNTDLANKMKSYADQTGQIKVELIFRDQIGLSAAYRKVKELMPDVCISLHFNAFNGEVTGTETLTSRKKDDREFSSSIHNVTCDVFDRKGSSRGVKVIPRSANGGTACYALDDIPNCLIEPFFGDVKSEADLALKVKDEYAKALVDTVVQYFKGNQLL